MSGPFLVATLAAALGCGLAAGVFFAFSSFVMPALKRLPSAQGTAAMQSINELAVTPAFMTALFGTAAVVIGLVVWALIAPAGRPVGLLAAGAAAYLIGTIGVTIAANVPLNERLATLDPGADDAPDHWRAYLRGWTAWNHLRTAAALAAAAAFAVALG